MTPIALESQTSIRIMYIVSFFNISKIEQGVSQALRVSMVTQVITYFNKVRLSLLSALSLMKF